MKAYFPNPYFTIGNSIPLIRQSILIESLESAEVIAAVRRR